MKLCYALFAFQWLSRCPLVPRLPVNLVMDTAEGYYSDSDDNYRHVFPSALGPLKVGVLLWAIVEIFSPFLKGLTCLKAHWDLKLHYIVHYSSTLVGLSTKTLEQSLVCTPVVWRHPQSSSRSLKVNCAHPPPITTHHAVTELCQGFALHMIHN